MVDLTMNVDGVVRPTMNSNGEVIAASGADLVRFWRWFGDSQWVDDLGRPIVAYHGTNKKFDSFDESKAVSFKGIFFTTDQELASNYGTILIKAYLKGERRQEVNSSADFIAELVKTTQERSYDSILYQDVSEVGNLIHMAVVFSSDQIVRVEEVRRSELSSNRELQVDSEDLPVPMYRAIVGEWIDGDRQSLQWFASSAKSANDYISNQLGENIVKAYLEIKKPANLEDDKVAQSIVRSAGVDPGDLFAITGNEQVKRALLDAGYDGIQAFHHVDKEWHFAPFSSGQIKLAIGNSGLFDSGLPMIRDQVDLGSCDVETVMSKAPAIVNRSAHSLLSQDFIELLDEAVNIVNDQSPDPLTIIEFKNIIQEHFSDAVQFDDLVMNLSFEDALAQAEADGVITFIPLIVGVKRMKRINEISESEREREKDIDRFMSLPKAEQHRMTNLAQEIEFIRYEMGVIESDATLSEFVKKKAHKALRLRLETAQDQYQESYSKASQMLNPDVEKACAERSGKLFDVVDSGDSQDGRIKLHQVEYGPNSRHIQFRRSVVDCYHNQINCVISAFDKGEQLGELHYSVFEETPEISFIEVVDRFKGNGVGTALVHELQREFPTIEISWGDFLTEEGSALRNSLRFHEVETEFAALASELTGVLTRLEDFTDRHKKGTLTSVEFDQWNGLHDRRDDLQAQLQGNPTTKRLIVIDSENNTASMLRDIGCSIYHRVVDDSLGSRLDVVSENEVLSLAELRARCEALEIKSIDGNSEYKWFSSAQRDGVSTVLYVRAIEGVEPTVSEFEALAQRVLGDEFSHAETLTM